jgi:hypothetical protein
LWFTMKLPVGGSAALPIVPLIRFKKKLYGAEE